MPKKRKKKDNTLQSIFNPKSKSNFITIKTSLKSILKDYNKNFTIIDKLVKDSNDIVIDDDGSSVCIVVNEEESNDRGQYDATSSYSSYSE